jgi:hypothetical protein
MPQLNCNALLLSQIPVDLVHTFLERKLISKESCERWERLQVLAALPAEMRTHCPRCRALAALPEDGKSTRVSCGNERCGVSYCHACASLWHQGKVDSPPL